MEEQWIGRLRKRFADRRQTQKNQTVFFHILSIFRIKSSTDYVIITCDFSVRMFALEAVCPVRRASLRLFVLRE